MVGLVHDERKKAVEEEEEDGEFDSDAGEVAGRTTTYQECVCCYATKP